MHHENNSGSSDHVENEEIDEFPWEDEELESRDTRLMQLENLIRTYRRKPNNAPLSSKGVAFFALWLHRWMLHKIQSREFHEHIERGILTATYGEQISRETLSLQRQATEDIAKASKLLHQRLGALLTPESLGSALEQAYTELRATAKEHPEDKKYRNINSFMERFNSPSWTSLRDIACSHLILIEEIAQKANTNLENTRAKMGQPKKSDRDRLFSQWQKRISSDLRMPLDSSTYLASRSWEIYFKNDEISEDAAKKIIRRQRINDKGK